MTMIQPSVEVFDPKQCPEQLLSNITSEENLEELCEWIITSLDEVEPDYTSILSSYITLIDVGNSLLCRVGCDIDQVKYGKYYYY